MLVSERVNGSGVVASALISDSIVYCLPANDAHYTAAALLEMARGPHFSVMRELVEKRVDDKEKQSVVKPTTGKKGFAKSKMRTWSATSSSSSRF